MHPSLLLLLTLLLGRGHAAMYPRFPSRRIQTLDGLWSFAYLGPSAGDPVTLNPTSIATPSVMLVPSAWDNQPGLYGQRGTAVYRTTIAASPGVIAKLKFEACSFYCAVWVDGAKVADHGIGYAPFWVGNLPPAPANGQRLIEVVSDNRFNITRAYLHGADSGYDFYQYGGILRSVEYHELAPISAAVSLQAADVIMRDPAAGLVDVRIRVHDYTRTTRLFVTDTSDGGDSGGQEPWPLSSGSLPTQIQVNISFDWQATPTVTALTVPVDAWGVALVQGVTVPSPSLWSPQAPNLHTIHVSLVGQGGAAGPETIVDSFGLRSVTACPVGTAGHHAVCINGVPYKLTGFSKHDVHVTFGSATPPSVHFLDYALLKGIAAGSPALSAPFFRLVHYPHAREELETADALGVPVWTEALGWGNSGAFIQDPRFVAQQVQCIEEAVNNTFNHPAAILFAFLNEGASDDAKSCPTYSHLAATYRALKVNGLVTWATDHGSNDKCLDAADVVSFNSYPEWYGWDGALNCSTVVPTINNEADWVLAHQQGKPFIKSEIGAGAVPGFRDPFGAFWSEEYQANLDGIVATAVATDDRFAGCSIWQYVDARTGSLGGNQALGRPRSFNNKGVFDEYRRPKLAVQAVQEGFAQAKWGGGHAEPPVAEQQQQQYSMVSAGKA